MDKETEIKKLIEEGEYFRALGFPYSPDGENTPTRLEIDTASARLSQAYPELAGVLSGITQVIVDPDKEKIYRITYGFRNKVMRSLIERFGSDFLEEFVPNWRAVIWFECQRLLRCDFEKADVKIGPKGAVSLANRGQEWIIESVINRCLLVLECDADEKRSGQAIRRIISKANCPKCGNTRQIPCPKCEGAGRITTSSTDEVRIPILTDDFDQIERDFTTTVCSDCGGTGTIPCDCWDTYIFQIPRGATPGSVIMGHGKRTNKAHYCILDHKVVTPRPYLALLSVYRAYNMRQNLPWLGEAGDLTLEYFESHFNICSKIMLTVWLLFGAIIGKFLGSWLTGAVISIAVALGVIIRQRYMFRPKIYRTIGWLILIVPPILGAFIGHFLTSWQSGATIGGILSGVLVAFFLIALRIQKSAR